MVSDLSFNIIALDKASSTFIKLAEQVDRLSERLDRLDGKNVDVDVHVKTDESSNALDSFSTRFKLMAGAIIAGSPAIGAAIVGGVGLGFIGVAAIAQKSNKDVQDAYTGMWRNVVTGAKNATDQLVPQIVGSAHAIDAELTHLGPSMKQAFSAAGPDIVALTRGVTDFAHNAVPGATSAMQNSLPVFEGIANVTGTLGAAFGATAQSMGQHAAEYGTTLTSMGNITSSVIGGATVIVNDLAVVWSQNSTEIDGAVDGVTTTIAGLANGVLPVLSFSLGTAASAVKVITSALGPLAPILGTTAATAGAVWVGFKLADLATAGVRLLAGGVVTLGGSMEIAAAKSATMIAGMRGVAVEASVAATTVKAAGAGAATAAVGFGAATEAIAGPLGIALVAGTVLFGLFAGGEDKAKLSATDLKSAVDSLTSAFETSHGAVDKHVVDTLKSTEAYKNAAAETGKFGVSQAQLTGAVVSGGPALENLRKQLDGVIQQQAAASGVSDALGQKADKLAQSLHQPSSALSGQAQAARTALDALNALAGSFDNGRAAAAKNAQAQQEASRVLVGTAEFQDAAGRAAKTLGLSLGDVSAGFQNVVSTGGSASDSVTDVAAGFIKASLGIAQAEQAIQDHFVTADKAVATAQTGLADATSSYQHSLTSIQDAQHSYAQAQAAVAQADQGVADAQHAVSTANRSLQDAYQGVTTAQQTYTRAQQQELQAQVALNQAREQAIEDLKALHLQMEDQVVTEESAKVRLFDATNSSLGFGVNAGNAKAIAAQDITATNEAQIKSAIDLLSAQNALNNAMNSGANLRKQVAEADTAGVSGAKGVISAQEALRSAQDQVKSSAQGVVKAQQQVTDAAYALQQANRALTKAHQGVTDAAYGEQKAHQAVRDAQDQSARSAAALQRAKQTLAEAVAADSRSLDINTKAGQTNLNLLLALWAAIQATGMSTEDKYRSMIDNTARSLGLSKEAAAEYLKQLGLIDKDFKYSVTAIADVDLSKLPHVMQTILGTGPDNQITTLGGLMALPGRAEGGPIGGVGGPKDDANLIWASKDEYMQPVDAVQHYGIGFMEAVRTKKFPRGGDGAALPGFASGGLVGASLTLGLAGANYQSAVNALTVMGLPHPPGLPKYVPPPMAAFGGGPNGVIPTGQHLALIDAALAADGIARADWPRWEAGMNVLIQRESGWNANAVNRWDSNAAAGHPSGGLTQTIAGTFAANRNSSLPNNMFDPVANIAASINYIRRRYGDISRVQQANPNLPPKGYDNGGTLKPGMSLTWNGTGKPENVRTAAAEDELLTAVKTGRGETHYHLAVYSAANQEINLKAQFKRMEIESGML